MSLIRKSSYAALTALVIAGSRFLLLAILARRLSTAGFGQFAYAQWLVDIAFLAVAFGANGVASRYLAEFGNDTSRRTLLMRRWLPWALGLPLLAGGAAAAAASFSGLRLSSAGYAALGAWTIGNGWWAMQTAALIGQQRFDLILRANLTASTIIILGAALLPLENSSPEILFICMAFATLLACSFGIRHNLAHFAKAAGTQGIELPWGRIRAYALNVWLTGLLLSLVWSRGELPVVRAHLGDHGVGQYTATLALFFGATHAVMVWVGGIAPHLTTLWGSEQKEEALRLARKLSDAQMLISGIAAVLLASLAPEILSLAFGSAYREGALPLAILLLALVTLSGSVHNHLLQLSTNGTFNRNVALGGVVLLYAAALMAVPWLGINGAAIARALTMWAVFLSLLFMVRRLWGHAALSGRNSVVAIGVISLPAILVSGGSSYLTRTLIAFPCLVLMVYFLRGEQGTLVLKDILSVAKIRRS